MKMDTQEPQWPAYSRLILAELKRLDKDIRIMNDTVSQMNKDMEGIKIKNGIWGGLGAFLGIVVYYSIETFLK